MSSTDCGPSFQAVPTFLEQNGGTHVTFWFDDGWTIKQIAASYARQDRINPSGHDPSLTSWFGDGPGVGAVEPNDGGEVTVEVPPPCDWGVVVTVTATNGRDEFTVPDYFRIKVDP